MSELRDLDLTAAWERRILAVIVPVGATIIAYAWSLLDSKAEPDLSEVVAWLLGVFLIAFAARPWMESNRHYSLPRRVLSGILGIVVAFAIFVLSAAALGLLDPDTPRHSEPVWMPLGGLVLGVFLGSMVMVTYLALGRSPQPKPGSKSEQSATRLSDHHMSILQRLMALLGIVWIAQVAYWLIVLQFVSRGRHLATIAVLFGVSGVWAIASWFAILIVGPIAVVQLWRLQLSGVLIGALLLANSVAVEVVDFVSSGGQSGLSDPIIHAVGLGVLVSLAVSHVRLRRADDPS
jgi:hypothetical protein